jgi:uncharacterized metal-binding protein
MEQIEESTSSIIKLMDRVRNQFIRKGRAYCADDAAQSYAVNLLEGKGVHQTIDQFCIDYLRKSSGRKKSKGYEARTKLEHASKNNEELVFQNINTIESLNEKIDSEKFLSGIRDQRKLEIIKRFMIGETFKEIGNSFGITESRVAQITAKTLEERLMEQNNEEWINFEDAILKIGCSRASLSIYIRDKIVPSELKSGKRMFKVSDCDIVNDLMKKHGSTRWKDFLPWANQIKEKHKPAPEHKIETKQSQSPASFQKAQPSTFDDAMTLAKDLLRAGHKEFAFRAFEIAAK